MIKRCRECGVIVGMRNRSGLCLSCAKKKTWANAEFKKRCGRAIAASLARPDVRARRSRSIAIAMNRPETKAKFRHPASEEARRNIRLAQQRPELRALHSKLSSGKKNYFYGKPGTNRGKFGPAHPMYGKHFYHSPETKNKLSGANNYGWKGGVAPDIYKGTFTERIKNEIRERDRFQCRLCNKPEGKRHHPVHHIFYSRFDSNPSKLITLCPPCHNLVHKQKKIWPPILLEKLGGFHL